MRKHHGQRRVTADRSAVFHRRLDYEYPAISHGRGIYLFDERGNRYIDGVGGALAANIGHGVREVAREAGRLAGEVSFLHGAQFTTRRMETYARDLVHVAPRGLTRVYFTSGASEAVETALKMARQYHYDAGNGRKSKIIYTRPSYHGATLLALSVTGKDAFREIQRPYLLPFPWVHSPFCYHCPFHKNCPGCLDGYARELEDVIREHDPDTIAAFIMEPVIGAAAGAVVPPREYFSVITKICRAHDILIVADEVMTGMGRTGRWFACQHFDFSPDILVAGKGISGGLVPLSAVLCSTRVYETIARGSGRFVHGHTFVNNPFTTGVGAAVLAYLKKNKLVAACARQGRYLLAGLNGLRALDIVGDVRGIGLMTAVEFVQNRETRQPFPARTALAARVLQAAQRRGLILYFCTGFVDGVDGDAVMVAPPFTVTRKEIDEIVRILREAIVEVSASLSRRRRESR